MSVLDNKSSIYFIGIGGIGMSALARYCINVGITVFGYDKTNSEMITSLSNEGAQIILNDDVNLIPKVFNKVSDEALIVYTPAIPADLKIKNHFVNIGFSLIKRAALLGMISENKFVIAVAGTHGKTTTSTLLAHLFYQSGYNMVAILGGIGTNYNSNYLYQNEGKKIQNLQILITEADEFDRSFLQLYPDIAIITSTDADHLDIYIDNESILSSFQTFASQIKNRGTLIVNEKAEIKKSQTQKLITYGSLSNSESYYKNLHQKNSKQIFDWVYNEKEILAIEAGMSGKHNVENATAAATAAIIAGMEIDEIKNNIASFKGVKRRFEIVYDQFMQTVIDDYAHHPTELEALIDAVKTLYPEREITLLFQPHLYSRTRDFELGFAASLSKADHVWLLPIYPARELPIANVSSNMLIEKITAKTTMLVEKSEVLELISKDRPGLLVIAGAGDIDRLVNPIKTLYNNE